MYFVNKGNAQKLIQNLQKKNFILNCSYWYPEIQNTLNSDGINEDIKFEKEETNSPTNLILDCSSKDLFNKICKTEDQTLPVEIKDNIITNIINDIINGNLDSILDDITKGDKEDYIINEDDVLFQLTTTENQDKKEYNNISSINLGECENELKKNYSIDESTPLIILKVDYFMKEFNIPVIGYEVFDPINKTKLDLSICKDLNASYHIPVDINEKELDKYNISSDYYNDECSVYTTEDGTDIIILDRKKEYNDKNMFLCENNCEYIEYNISTKKSVCDCKIKSKIYSISEILENKDSFAQNIDINDTSSSSSSLSSMKCLDTLFSKYGLLKNLESYILIISTIIFAFSGILFQRIGWNLLDSDIQDILENKRKIKKKIKPKDSKKSLKRKSQIRKNSFYNHNKNSDIIIVANPKKKRRSVVIKKEKESNSVYLGNTNVIINQDQQKPVSNIKMNTKKYDSNINIVNLTIYELNRLPYNEALLIDKRDFIEMYFSLIRTKHPLLFSFIPMRDYNAMIIKLDIFILYFSICSAINALFFTEDTIHRIYMDKGTYNLSYFLLKTILSFVISHVIIIVLKYIFLSERSIVNIKKKQIYDEAFDTMESVKRCLIIKYILFYAIGVVFLVLFWFYLSAFCAVYQNTQIFLIINTFISLGISFIYPFIINIIPAALRKISLNNSGKTCLYSLSKIIQII